MSLGVKFWIKDTNERGGMYLPEAGKRLPVRLISGDDRSSPPYAATQYEKLVKEDRVDVIISGGSSEIQKDALLLTERYGIVNINCGAPDDSLFEGTKFHLMASKGGLRSAASNPLRPQFFKEYGLTRVAQIFPDVWGWNTYSAGLKAAVEAAGLEMVLQWAAPLSGSYTTEFGAFAESFEDWSSIIDMVEQARPDALVIAFPSPAQYFLIREMRKRDLWYAYIEMTYGASMMKTGLGPEDLIYLFGGPGPSVLAASLPPPSSESEHEVTVGYTRGQFEARVREVMWPFEPSVVGLSHYLGLALWEYPVAAGSSIDGGTVMKTALGNPDGMADMLGPIEFLPNGMQKSAAPLGGGVVRQFLRDPSSGELQAVSVYPKEAAVREAEIPSPKWSARELPWRGYSLGK